MCLMETGTRRDEQMEIAMSNREFEMDQDRMLELYQADPAALRQAIEREARQARSEAVRDSFAAIGAVISRRWVRHGGQAGCPPRSNRGLA
jgi:hypothetical protein